MQNANMLAIICGEMWKAQKVGLNLGAAHDRHHARNINK